MNIKAENTVAEVVTDNIQTAHIFKKHGIDFCCGGGISIAKACEKKAIHTDDLIKELNSVYGSKETREDYATYELNDLIQHIINKHHHYVSSSIPLLDSYLTKVIKVHGSHHPALHEIGKLYDELKNELIPHLQKEEAVLFPYIQYLCDCKKQGIMPHKPPFGNVSSPIVQMQHEHDHAGETMHKINHFTMQYTPPDWACNTFKAMYAKLKEFEDDLHIHVHLENNILFRKAVELEQSFS